MPIDSTHRLLAAAGRILLGKEHAVRLALACVFARGHLLIEDIPGRVSGYCDNGCQWYRVMRQA